ncbi:MAG: type II toxin-antitoxin system YafQ family toxin [Paludisphaera borealis]|uniref:type II toxin-antitoxin system YafQ family toxin n=1 Tax=Paludisphaera borealis TaxID=1387353 RepID=UPI0028482D23|nr:type II toxin-antitoxin system YafQ family toxin [Paludisphaera borealis]MDR3619852.1 type II toxin-antitoxin system YafQ family toxin [Paludisphaera borealis]
MVRKRKPKPRPEPVVEPIAPPPLEVVPGQRFKHDLKRLKSRGKNLAKLLEIIDTLCARRPLEARHCDHPLKGNLDGYRDCHVEPDWVMVYKRTETELRLFRTGSHSDLGL